MKFDEFPIHNDGFIQEGVAPTDELLALACTVGEDYDHQKNELGLAGASIIARFGISGEAFVSIDADQDGSVYALGEYGVVVQFRWKDVNSLEELKASRKLIRNPQAADLGPMRRIRVIDGTAVCVGAFGQVYVLRDGAFDALPFVEIYPDAVTLKDIAGTRLDDMVAVSQHGVAAHFNGRNWTDLQLPTNMKLSSVQRLEDGRYAIAACGGLILIGAGDSWEIVDVDEPDRDYYGIAAQGGLIYAAHIGGIDVYDGQVVEEVAYDNKEGLEFAFLRPGQQGVWAFSGQTIGFVQGREWKTILRRPAA